jgi:hypothetical protein
MNCPDRDKILVMASVFYTHISSTRVLICPDRDKKLVMARVFYTHISSTRVLICPDRDKILVEEEESDDFFKSRRDVIPSGILAH